jgi:hypothetical protein
VATGAPLRNRPKTSTPMELEAVEIARCHLEAMWNEPGSEFKHFDSTQLPSPKRKPSTLNKSTKQSETQPEEWVDDEGIRDVLSMGPFTTAGKAKVAKQGPSSSSSSGAGSSGAGSSGAGSSGAGSSNSSAVQNAPTSVLDQLREGSVPFGTFVSTVVLKKSTVSKRKVDELTRDCLRAVSPDALPSALGRKDQFTKRLHLPDPRPVSDEVLDHTLDPDLRAKMCRAQAYSRRDDRPHIMWACVEAFRNAP